MRAPRDDISAKEFKFASCCRSFCWADCFVCASGEDVQVQANAPPAVAPAPRLTLTAEQEYIIREIIFKDFNAASSRHGRMASASRCTTKARKACSSGVNCIDI